MLRWLVPLAIGVLGFLLGGGWPLKAYRRIGDLDLAARMKERFPTREEFDAHLREEELRHQRRDDIIDMLTRTMRTLESFAGTLSAQGEAIKYQASELQELKEEVRSHFNRD